MCYQTGSPSPQLGYQVLWWVMMREPRVVDGRRCVFGWGSALFVIVDLLHLLGRFADRLLFSDDAPATIADQQHRNGYGHYKAYCEPFVCAHF